MTTQKRKLVAAVAAALIAGAIGSGITFANADPAPVPPPSPTIVDTPEPGDTPDVPGAEDIPEPGDTPDIPGDQDSRPEGDESGPEAPDNTVPTPAPAPPAG